ncbi:MULTISPECIES: glycosyltransferase family 4 protein [unclassified Rhizobium]|uniref:glycosyltransferase family 4 protein n=1 Tax=unclassified Rhizobium TaxID=2613769 RepID=UPI00177E3DE7|nr:MULTISPECIES: glycosyltransferase family 1 protein [unclassified Rhizobium]MBD8688576.1 glycosyltransferase family 4 protein [Rhizobium sp. CFBP 13644]MBD8692922.1 glycosyltransferase family 4 protein [Rhizobium sp. CFBP 13717]
MTTFINGRFLTQKTSGVQRFAREIVKALDRHLASQKASEDWVLLAPENAPRDLDLSAIRQQNTGGLSGHIWEQTQLYAASRRGRLINLCNSGPVLHGRSLTVIHDAMIFRTPENFSRPYRAVHGTLGHVLSRRGRIATVSEFSKRELAETIGAKNVSVIPNSCEHLASIQSDETVLNRLNLVPQTYLLFVGSPTPNKNIHRAVEAIGSMGGEAPQFVVVGATASSVFNGDAQDASNSPGTDRVIFTGRLTDEEIVALYANAAALLFPSLYEGFGIPPLEAMLLGCPVLSSSIEPAQEVCGRAALYFDPHNAHDIVRAIRDLTANPQLRGDMIAQGHLRAAEFSWDRSANSLLKAISGL